MVRPTRPDACRQPAGRGPPAGAGHEQWVEGYVHYGIYGITPVTPNVYVYGGLSAITSGSAGQELFTDETRTYTDVEDAHVGVIGGQTDTAGNRLAYNLSVGRQRFTLANGFLLANTAANGQERAAGWPLAPKAFCVATPSRCDPRQGGASAAQA